MERYKNGLLLLARVLFSLIFISGAIEHLTQINSMAGYAASAGVPFPKLAIVVTGLMLLIGSISVLLGWKTAYGAIILILFLIPVTYQVHFLGMLHATDPMQKQMQMTNMLKNIGLIGGAIYIAFLGAGKYSIDKQ
ncbi:MAG: DoxX family protein [bacterium]